MFLRLMIHLQGYTCNYPIQNQRTLHISHTATLQIPMRSSTIFVITVTCIDIIEKREYSASSDF